MAILKDEQGKWSSARCALWVILGLLAYLVISGKTRSTEAWTTLRETLIGLIGWAGGTRAVQYISKLRSTLSPGANSSLPENTGITPGDSPR